MQAYVAGKQLSLDEVDLLNLLLDARDDARVRARKKVAGG